MQDLFSSQEAALSPLADRMRPHSLDEIVGRAPQQVQEFLAEEIRPILERYGKELSAAAADSVNV